jgi:3-hydroxy-9,10-secoandrosta-1,3,5(10)-triene-9,17-dione monooxygenase
LSELLAGTPPGAAVHTDYPLVRAPRGLLVNYSLPPVAIALGRRALAVAMDSLRDRVSRGTTQMSGSEFVQMTLAEAAAAIDAATLTMYRGRTAAEELVGRGDPVQQEFVMRARRDMTYAQHQVQWAVEKLVELCGARSVYDNDMFATIRRDVLTVLTHNVASRQAAMGAWGRWALNVR